ncbi:hypothetical protein AQ611_03820 [Burkholderia singularis]|nr:hypothetical protein AQ611_03820 [Burkholderia sp. Bp7605]
MASINNRSRYFVHVKKPTGLDRDFPFNRVNDAKAYYAQLVAQKYKPELGQYEDCWEVRIQQKGHPNFSATARSLEEANDIVETIRQERKKGLFRDYTKAHQVTFVDLIRRYMAEEGPKHKGWAKVEKYKCSGWLADVKGDLAKRDTKRQAEIAEHGHATTARGAMRKAATGLEWMEKPFAHVHTTDIEGYVRDRLEIVAPATVDREIDVLSSIFNVAIKVWKYRVDENPMTGVRRPRYFNERDRRLKAGEEARLLASAREEDRLRSIALRTEALMLAARDEAAHLPTVYQKKDYIKTSLAACRRQAEQDYVHVPLYEAFATFQLMTGARRGESLDLPWEYVDFEERTAYLEQTKNGRPRKLPLRENLVAILETLPRDDVRVFPLGTNALSDAWRRVTVAAIAIAIVVLPNPGEPASRWYLPAASHPGQSQSTGCGFKSAPFSSTTPSRSCFRSPGSTCRQPNDASVLLPALMPGPSSQWLGANGLSRPCRLSNDVERIAFAC